MKSKSELTNKQFCDKLKCVVGACEHTPNSTSCLYWKFIDKGTDELYKQIVKEFNKTVRSLEYVSDNTAQPVVERAKAKTNSKVKKDRVKKAKGSTSEKGRMGGTRNKVSTTANRKVK